MPSATLARQAAGILFNSAHFFYFFQDVPELAVVARANREVLRTIPNPPDKVNTLPSRRLNAKASRTAKPMNFPGLSLAFGELESAGTLFSCS